MGRLKALPPRFGALPPRVAALPKQAESFYTSAAWRALVADIRRVRGPWCERCGAGGRLIGDHKRERRDGGADLDPANVELLCAARCHPAKTARERARRARGETGPGRSSGGHRA